MHPLAITTQAVKTAKEKALWQHIFADGYTDPKKLLYDLGLANSDVSADALFATRVPKPFVEKMRHNDPKDPLLLQVLPQKKEFDNPPHFSPDPLAEKQYNPLPGVLHKYSSRILLTFRNACAINCRYCFRRHFAYADNRINKANIDKISAYIDQHPTINEIILSGGDPLMASDRHIGDFIVALAEHPQLKRLRLHTRLPVVIPERMTDGLVSALCQTRLKPVVVFHCNHPNELDAHFNTHANRLSQAGVQMLNQSVLLKNINDNAETLAQLSEKLFDAHILPYYLFLLDKVTGASHFEVDANRAHYLIRNMAAKLPGYLVPKLTRETPGLASKDMWV